MLDVLKGVRDKTLVGVARKGETPFILQTGYWNMFCSLSLDNFGKLCRCFEQERNALNTPYA